jgi:hypothetical protein
MDLDTVLLSPVKGGPAMTREFSAHSYHSLTVPFVEMAPPHQPSQEDWRAVREAELRAATLEYEAELRDKFDQLPKWTTLEDGQLRHHYWNGQKWIEFDFNDPPLWAVENMELDSLAAPGV